MVEFYWNRDYTFDPAKKYLVYYRGCFCPCTAGHVSLLEPFLGQENVTVFISQAGSEARHGVPYEVNHLIWKRYIEHCLPPDTRVILQKMHGSQDIEPHLSVRTEEGIDRVLYLMGIEHSDLMDGTDEGLSRRRRKREKKLRKDRKHLIQILKRRDIGLDFILVDRPHKKTLSATQFVQAVKRGDHMEQLEYYMPATLPKAQKREIVSKLRSLPLH